MPHMFPNNQFSISHNDFYKIIALLGTQAVQYIGVLPQFSIDILQCMDAILFPKKSRDFFLFRLMLTITLTFLFAYATVLHLGKNGFDLIFIVAVAGIGICLFAAKKYFIEFKDHKAGGLYVDATGISFQNYWESFSVRTIPWQWVQGVRTEQQHIKYTTLHFLVLDIQDLTAFSAALSPIEKVSMTGFTSLKVPLTFIDASPEEICQTARKFLTDVPSQQKGS